MSVQVIAIRLRCNLCDADMSIEPLDLDDPLNPAKVPSDWRAFAEEPGGRIDRHWCSDCCAWMDRYAKELGRELRRRPSRSRGAPAR